MRFWPFVILASISGSSGCSMLIAGSGRDVSTLRTQDQVRKVFGEPIGNGVENGKRYEDVRTHRKIAEVDRALSGCIPWGMTCGLAEFYRLPVELFGATKAAILGQNLRFYYDDMGNVEDCKLNCECLFLWSPWFSPPEKSVQRDVEVEPNLKLAIPVPADPPAANDGETKP